MRYFDQHTHTRCSPDSSAPPRAMAEAARDRGMELICFTDHVDMDNDETGTLTDAWIEQLPRIREEYAALRADPPAGIRLRFGMELGGANHAPEAAARAVAEMEPDLVIGSLHNLRDTPDFFLLTYTSREQCAAYNRAYLRELAELAELDCFDVMGHIGYTSRYMRTQGFPEEITAEDYREELTAVFRPLIHGGRGIEVNTSGLYRGGGTYPCPSALALYRELGGELLTVGSDAHTPAHAGDGIREAYALLESLGFRYVARFTRRQSELIRIV